MVEGRENVKERGRKYLEALSKNGKRNGKKIGSGNGSKEKRRKCGSFEKMGNRGRWKCRR